MRDDVMPLIQARFCNRVAWNRGITFWNRPGRALFQENRLDIHSEHTISMVGLEIFDQNITQMILRGCAYQGRIDTRRRRH